MCSVRSQLAAVGPGSGRHEVSCCSRRRRRRADTAQVSCRPVVLNCCCTKNTDYKFGFWVQEGSRNELPLWAELYSWWHEALLAIALITSKISCHCWALLPKARKDACTLRRSTQCVHSPFLGCTLLSLKAAPFADVEHRHWASGCSPGCRREFLLVRWPRRAVWAV